MPCICKLGTGSSITVARKVVAIASGYLNVRHSYSDSLDKKP
jgi:hypothetical protein